MYNYINNNPPTSKARRVEVPPYSAHMFNLISHTHILTIYYFHILYLIARGGRWGQLCPHPKPAKLCFKLLCNTYYTILTILYYTYLWDLYHMLVCTQSGAISTLRSRCPFSSFHPPRAGRVYDILNFWMHGKI